MVVIAHFLFLCEFAILQGMDSGFGDDEAYTVYDKPWRADKDAASNIYRPTRNKDKDTYGDDLDEIMKTNRSDVFLNAFCILACLFLVLAGLWLRVCT